MELFYDTEKIFRGAPSRFNIQTKHANPFPISEPLDTHSVYNSKPSHLRNYLKEKV